MGTVSCTNQLNAALGRLSPAAPGAPSLNSDSLGQACDLRSLVTGVETQAPLLGGARRQYVNLDNAATTPPFRGVMDQVNGFVNWYSSVHRGAGFKSYLSTELYERCRQIVLDFVGGSPSHHTVIFCCNTTDAVNYLCRRLKLRDDELVLTTLMEHHSNLLPWRLAGPVDYVGICQEDGSLDMAQLEAKLAAHGGRVKLVAVTGASNVTGFMPPVRRIARLAHEHGAWLLVDAAQLIAHRPVSMGGADDPERIDFLAFSGHKMYAPFGSGALVGPREAFGEGTPSRVGGGAVDLVTLNDIEWAAAPEKEEAGTPNLMGALALAKAAQIMGQIGMERVAQHERELTREALKRLSRIARIRVFGQVDPLLRNDRLGVIPIQADNMDHALLAAVLSYEWGIGVRNGCFCAHPYMERLLGLDDKEMERILSCVRCGDHRALPGFVRISVGLYNNLEEIDYLAHALEEIMRNGPQGVYLSDKQTGTYRPEGFTFDLSDAPFL